MGEVSRKTDDLELMRRVGDLVAFIQSENPSINQLCEFAVQNTFDFLQPISLFGASLDGEGMIRPIGQYGFTEEIMQSWSESSIDEDLPISDALKTNNIVWLADKSQWLRDYPHLAHYENDFTTNTFITWPITVRNAYMSALGLCATQVEPPTPALISFFEIVGGIFAIQISTSSSEKKTSEMEEFISRYKLLTRRQNYVLRLLAEGLTNQEIGRELGFSESTIRHETMRIYEILGVAGRAEAITKYRLLK